MTSSDAFCTAFDAIEIDPANAPAASAIEAALAMCARADAPGFFLLDDADGLFTIDRDFGFISLRNEAALEAERGQIRSVRLKVIEHSGASYEITLRLRISGRVPQLVSESEEAPPPATIESSGAAMAWSRYAGFEAAGARAGIGDEQAPFGALTAPAPPVAATACELSLGAAMPRSAHAGAAWSL